MHTSSNGLLRDAANRVSIVLFIALTVCLWPALQPARAAQPSKLRVYVSLPQKGANAETSKLIVKGLRAALRAQHNRVGNRPIRLVELNDAKGARWNPKLVRRNARRAVKDPAAIAYVGELNSEATAIAKPIIERAGMPMFAPVSTADSLTRPGARRSNGAKPSLFRTIPNDSAQAVALVSYLWRSKVRRFVLVDDGALYGRSLANGVAAEARGRGLRIIRRYRANRDGKGRRGLVRRIAAARPQAVLFAGSQSSDAAGLFRALHQATPRTLLFGGDALAHDSFARSIGRAQKMARVVRPSNHTDPRNRALRRLLGYRPDPVTVFAFDGMRAILRAAKRADAGKISTAGKRRAAIRDALFSGRLERGAVGLWKIRPNGDSSNGLFDAILLRNGRAIEPAETATRRQLKRRALNGRASSGPTSRMSSGLLTSGDIEEALQYVQRERARLLDEQLEGQIDEVRRRNEELGALNRLVTLLDELVAHFPADVGPENELQSLPDWNDPGSPIRRLLDEILAHSHASLLTDAETSAELGGVTRGQLDIARQAVKELIDTANSELLEAMLRLQALANKRNEAIDVLDNIRRNLGGDPRSIIGKLG